MTQVPVLYSYFRSSCSWRVRIGLALKGIDYEYKAVNLLKSEQHTDEFKSKNAVGALPALLHNGKTLTQSIAILEYLDEIYPDTHRLLPADDPIRRANVRRLSLLIAADIQPIQNLSVLKYVGDDKKVEFANWVITKGFKALEAELKKTSGKYCFGNEITMVDLCLVPQVYNASRFKVDMNEFPTIARINNELSGHPAFQAAHYTQQPDCPAELR